MAERENNIKHDAPPSPRAQTLQVRGMAWVRRHWRLLTGLAIAVLIYTLAGFFLVPHIARGAIQDFVKNQLHRNVAIGDIAFNPFTLIARIKQFSLTEADHSPLASFDALLVNVELSSLWHLAFTFKEVRLDRPQVHVVIFADRTLNLAKLVPAKPDKGHAESQLPPIRINSLAVNNGRLAFEDHTRDEPFTATLAPIAFSLSNFRTEPHHENAYHFAASTADQEKLDWSGEFSLQPVGSAGRFTVTQLKATTIASYLQDALPFELKAGTLDIAGRYELTAAGDFNIDLAFPSIKTRDLALAPRDEPAPQPWLSIPSVDIDNVAIGLAARNVNVGSISISGASASIWRESDGRINLQRLFARPTSTSVSPPAQAPSAPATASSWKIGVKQVELKDADVLFEDRSVNPVAHLHLVPIKVSLSDFVSDGATPVNLDSDIVIDSRSHLQTHGQLHTQPIAADLDLVLSDFELPPLQPYVAQQAALSLSSGRLGAKAHLLYATEPPQGQPHLKFTGDVRVADFATKDNVLQQDFVKWKELNVTGIDFSQDPNRLNIERITAIKPYSRLIIASNRTTNIAEILRPGRSRTAAPTATQPQPQAPVTATNTKPLPIRIRSIVVKDGSANFADYSIQPSFATGIQELQGSIDGLSSDPASRAKIKLVGNVGSYAPATIAGELNLLSATLYSDVAMTFRNMDLTIFNPYSGKFAGYDIAKGKLTTELKYKVRDRSLDAQHHIIVDQLEFGKETSSKDAVSIPVKLAVALLKDRNGVIELDLPVSGNLNDPEFRLGPIIWKVVVNLLTKAVTSPFALLGSIFGGGDELAYVAFNPGSAELLPAETEKLGKLAHALNERPQLKLSVPADTQSPADADAFAHAALAAATAAYAPKKPAPDADSAQKQRLEALEKLYEKEFKKAPQTTATDASTPTGRSEALEKTLLARYTPTPAQLSELARQRADAVRNAVVAQGQIDPERIFLTSDNDAAPVEGQVVKMQLKLDH